MVSEIEEIDNLMDLYQIAKSEFKKGSIENTTLQKINESVERLGSYFHIPYEEIVNEKNQKIFLDKLEKFIDALLVVLDNKTQSLMKEAEEKTRLPDNLFKL